MAWSYAVSADGDLAGELQGWMAQLEDARLIGELEATAEIRGDGSHLEFVSVGPVASAPSELLSRKSPVS